jgi:glutamyl-tRNA synthetase
MTASSPIITRFAPSPTGYLHIGGARTALFNYLFARHAGGKFILRIDDTDRARSTDAAVAALLDGLSWLGIEWDEGPIYQHQRLARHAEVAHELLSRDLAYRCYASVEELAEMRAAAQRAHRPPRYDGTWRDKSPAEAPPDREPAIRLKAPQGGQTEIDDLILGPVQFANAELDDFVLLRADGTPTYMLSTVVDDHDLGITHVIRGNEHLVNAARQKQLFEALGWAVPAFAHIPLIHGADGAKLSKRHGAVGVETYREDGFLPEAMVDYLSRLGWSHEDDAFLSMDELIAQFELGRIGKSPARFDLDKLTHINFHYLKQCDEARLVDLVWPYLNHADEAKKPLLIKAMGGLKERAKTLPHLAETMGFYLAERPIPIDPAALRLLDEAARARLARASEMLAALPDWQAEAIDNALKALTAELDLGFAKIAQPLRVALTGRTNSPGISEVLFLLGRVESLGRIEDALQNLGGGVEV